MILKSKKVKKVEKDNYVTDLSFFLKSSSKLGTSRNMLSYGGRKHLWLIQDALGSTTPDHFRIAAAGDRVM